MQSRQHTTTVALAVVALIAAAGLCAAHDGRQPVADAIAATTDGSPLSRSVSHAFPTAEAGFAKRRAAVAGR
jgi:hypothetical protein